MARTSLVQSLHEGESVSDQFTVTATDTFGGVSTTETLTITITGTNDIPVITGGLTGTTTEDTVVDFTGQLTGDDIDNSDSVAYGLLSTDGSDHPPTASMATAPHSPSAISDQFTVSTQTLTITITGTYTLNNGVDGTAR